MNTLPLTNTRTGATARILVESGFNLFELKLPADGRMIDILDATDDFSTTGQSPSHSGIPLLFPFPNRIRGGKYQWGGHEYVLAGTPQDGQGNAIHGLVIDRPWRVVQHGENFAVGEFRLSTDAADRRGLWPADFVIQVRYELRDAGLHCDVKISNPDQVPLPFGLGTHPYFRVPLSPKSKRGDCLIQARATDEWELVGCLPTGTRRSASGRKNLREGQELEGLKLDDAFGGLTPDGHQVETIVMDPAAGLQVRQTFDSVFRELVVYTPPHGRSVCLEPYTCITDAIHLEERGIDSGWRTLEPGGEFRTWFQIAVGPVYA
jgi:aldose 1-epimerase